MNSRPGPIQFRNVEIEPKLTARAAHGQGLGAVASRDLERYYETLRRSLPAFGRAEALAIMDACNGTIWEPWSVPLLWANVDDSEGLGKKWEIDQGALVARLRGLSYAEALAVVDAAERFWNHGGGYEIDTDAALEATGLVRHPAT